MAGCLADYKFGDANAKNLNSNENAIVVVAKKKSTGSAPENI